jgi:hypothetical protein
MSILGVGWYDGGRKGGGGPLGGLLIGMILKEQVL